MRYRLIDLDLSKPIPPVALAPDEAGIGLVARWQGRPVGFRMEARPAGAPVDSSELATLADRFADRLLAARVEAALPAPLPDSPTPSLTIAICTRNRAARLSRLLQSLLPLLADAPFPSVETLVIDNGSTDATAATVRAVPGVRYVNERRAGLNFARNAALTHASGVLIAFLDDDVVVDRGWLRGLASAWRSRLDAGGFTGLVLPFRLDTEAQRLFERRGGFSRGFERIEFRAESQTNPLFPVGAGSVGAGCNMAFDRQLLVHLGGFDEALDTGSPLPGGGDLDIFYRVLRSGRAMVYEPRYAVHHEHRATMAELRRQYWSWGLGLMAFLAKSRRSDPALRRRHGAMIRWWFGDQLRTLARSLLRGDLIGAGFSSAELRGGIEGLAGGYDRSQRRTAAIRAEVG